VWWRDDCRCPARGSARHAQSQLKGQAKQAAGAAEDLYGQAKDAAAGFTDIVQRTIAYSAIAIAVAIGWLLGRRIDRFNAA
jgi:ElaB/YqjD/DUF883 family membrane-anchored ribosome-binding protein